MRVGPGRAPVPPVVHGRQPRAQHPECQRHLPFVRGRRTPPVHLCPEHSPRVTTRCGVRGPLRGLTSPPPRPVLDWPCPPHPNTTTPHLPCPVLPLPAPRYGCRFSCPGRGSVAAPAHADHGSCGETSPSSTLKSRSYSSRNVSPTTEWSESRRCTGSSFSAESFPSACVKYSTPRPLRFQSALGARVTRSPDSVGGSTGMVDTLPKKKSVHPRGGGASGT